MGCGIPSGVQEHVMWPQRGALNALRLLERFEKPQRQPFSLKMYSYTNSFTLCHCYLCAL